MNANEQCNSLQHMVISYFCSVDFFICSLINESDLSLTGSQDGNGDQELTEIELFGQNLLDVFLTFH